ncbi:MAG: ATP-binding protein [Candidatus Omnitrophota bacterium]
MKDRKRPDKKEKKMLPKHNAGLLAAVMVLSAVAASVVSYNAVNNVFDRIEESMIVKHEQVVNSLMKKTSVLIREYFSGIASRLSDLAMEERWDITSFLGSGASGDRLNGSLRNAFNSIAYGRMTYDEKHNDISAGEKFIRYASIESVFLCDSKGRCVARASDDGKDWMVGKDLSDHDFFKEAASKNGILFSVSGRNAAANVKEIYISIPLLEDGRFIGVLSSKVNNSYFRKVFVDPDALENLDIFDGFIVAYIGSKPIVISHRNSANIGEEVKLINAEDILSKNKDERARIMMEEEVVMPDDIYVKMKGAERSVITKTVSLMGDEKIFAGIPIFEGGKEEWYLVGVSSSQEITKHINVLQGILFSFLAYTMIFFLVLTGIGVWFIKEKRETFAQSEKLEESEKKYRMVTEGAADIVWKADTEGNITFATPSVERILGYTVKEISFINIKNILTRRSYAKWERTISEGMKVLGSGKEMAGGNIMIMELEFIRADNTSVWCEVSCRAVPDREAKSGFELTGITRDISDRKQLQGSLIQAEKMAAVGTMAASVAHELRNPLGVINVALYNLKRTLPESDEKVQKHIWNMSKKIKEANKIINDLLNYSRISNANKADTDINSLLEETLARVIIGFPKKNVKVMKAFGRIPPVKVDIVQIGEVFYNITKNAYEAMPEGGELTLSTQIREKDLEISIKDSGVGMPKEDLDKLDKPFVSSKARGTGLGLALSYRIIRELHKGEMLVKSQLNRGTEFIIRLPIDVA